MPQHLPDADFSFSALSNPQMFTYIINVTQCLLEMILQSHVEVKGVPSVPEANSYESAAACRAEA